MREDFDYHNFDKLEVMAKTAKEKDLVNHYALFGWEEVNKTDDKRYFDLTHITFIRPHKIANKDRLQLLQIYYENYMNELYDCEKNKYIRSTIFVISTVIIGLILMAIGIITLLASPILAKILGGVFIVTSIVLTVCSFIKLKKVKRNEKNSFKEKYSDLQNKIDCVLQDAVNFVGGENAEE